MSQEGEVVADPEEKKSQRDFEAENVKRTARLSCGSTTIGVCPRRRLAGEALVEPGTKLRLD